MYGLFILFEKSHTRLPWENWSYLTMVVATLGAAGGILVAATLKYADAILKTLATAGSIVISTVLGHFLLDGPLDIVMAFGTLAVILSIFNYTMDASAAAGTVVPALMSTKDDSGHAEDDNDEEEAGKPLLESPAKSGGSSSNHGDKDASASLKTRKVTHAGNPNEE